VPAATTGVAPALGPPVLQSSSPLPASTPPHSQPPTLQPMMVPVSSAATPAAMPGSLTTSQTNGQVKSANAQGMNRASPAAQPVSQAGVTAVKTTPILPKGQLTSKALPDATSADKADMAVEGTPKAVVKPNVLTHVIDGHVIQESSQPFPLDDTTKARKATENGSTGSIPSSAIPKTTSSSLPLPPQLTPSQLQNSGTNLVPPTLAGLPYPGAAGSNLANKATTNTTTVLPGTVPVPTATSTGSANIKFGDDPAAALANVTNGSSKPPVLTPSGGSQPTEKKRGPGRPPGSTNRIKNDQSGNNKNDSSAPPVKKSKLDFEDKTPVGTGPVIPVITPSVPVLPTPPAKDTTGIPSVDMVTNNPLKWTVQQVCDFVKNLPGCSDYAEDFSLQEIDGQALMLLKADHLMSAMSIKLGPALKICSAVDAMREELKQN